MKPRHYLFGNVAFVRHPDNQKEWMKVDASVVWADCPHCGALKGVPCSWATKKYGSTTHWERRKAARVNKKSFGRKILNAEIVP